LFQRQAARQHFNEIFHFLGSLFDRGQAHAPAVADKLGFHKIAFGTIFYATVATGSEVYLDTEHLYGGEAFFKLIGVDFSVIGSPVQMFENLLELEILAQINEQILEFLFVQRLLAIDLDTFDGLVSLFQNTEIFKQKHVLRTQGVDEVLQFDVAGFILVGRLKHRSPQGFFLWGSSNRQQFFQIAFFADNRAGNELNEQSLFGHHSDKCFLHQVAAELLEVEFVFFGAF
jgi:hypothetical protein